MFNQFLWNVCVLYSHSFRFNEKKIFMQDNIFFFKLMNNNKKKIIQYLPDYQISLGGVGLNYDFSPPPLPSKGRKSLQTGAVSKLLLSSFAVVTRGIDETRPLFVIYSEPFVENTETENNTRRHVCFVIGSVYPATAVNGQRIRVEYVPIIFHTARATVRCAHLSQVHALPVLPRTARTKVEFYIIFCFSLFLIGSFIIARP